MKRILTLSAAAFIFQTLSGNALTLLIIDVTNPNAVKFTATTSNSSGSSSQRITFEGITLQDFFSTITDVPDTTAINDEFFTPTLVPTQSPAISGGIANRYSGLASYDFSDGTGNFGPGNDLSFYMNGGSGVEGSQVFTSGLRAFNGESVFNLSSFASALPASGTTGNITSGYLPSSAGAGHGVTLGQFTVIPEPSTAVLGALAAAALVVRRRRN